MKLLLTLIALTLALIPATTFAETYTLVGCSYPPGNSADSTPGFLSDGVGGRFSSAEISSEQYAQISDVCTDYDKTFDEPTTCCRLTFVGTRHTTIAPGGTLKGQPTDHYEIHKILKVEPYK